MTRLLLAALVALTIAGCGTQSGGGNGGGFEHHPSQKPTGDQVGDLAHCRELVGHYVFFQKNYPLTAGNRKIVDGYCKAAQPTEDAVVVGQAAESELQR